MADIDEEDPYALSSDSEDEQAKGPPPKINIEERAIADISSLKAALSETKETIKDDARLEELNALKEKSEISKIKQDFTEGKLMKDMEGKVFDEEREQIFAQTKEQYAKFKDAFEKMPKKMEQDLEEKLKAIEKELSGVGKETLANIKEAFENPLEIQGIEKEKIVVERSEADKKRILNTFIKPEMTADEAPRECAICSKIVYPVERVFVNKCLYHHACFKCMKCGKRLTPTNYNCHEKQILCKVHYLEIFHPELAKTMDPATTDEDERLAEDDDEFAVSSRPKQLRDDVVRSAVKTVDDFSKIASLKDRKGDWENTAKEAIVSVERKMNAGEEIVAGKVKANLERFVTRGVNDEVDDEQNEDDEERDPNIIREDKKYKEELKFDQVGDIKNRWKTGNIQGADIKEICKEDLEELKRGPGLKDRFKERNESDEDVKQIRQWDQNEIDKSRAADARRSFLEGSAFQTGPVEKNKEIADMEFKRLDEFKERFEKGEGDSAIEKTAIDVQIDSLSDKKSAFEKDETQATGEERAEQKKKEIEAEFLRYKLARRAAAQRHAEEKDSEGNDPGIEIPEVEVGQIKDRFEKGNIFTSQHGDKSELDVEIKMAGKAREKFKQIDAEGSHPVAPSHENKERVASKWDKKDNIIVPEPVNKRVIEDDVDEPEDEDAYDVKNLMNKFKNIEKEPVKLTTHERPTDLEGIKVEARSLKEQFEKVGESENENIDEKRKIIEEEFARLKQEKEAAAAAARESTPEEERTPTKEEIHIAADHASKMTAKWEKIQQKEAKKAKKSKMPAKSAVHADK